MLTEIEIIMANVRNTSGQLKKKSCSKCKKIILTEKQGGISVARCMSWFHSDCLNLSVSDLSRYVSTPFYCVGCADMNFLSQSVSIPESSSASKTTSTKTCPCSNDLLLNRLKLIENKIDKVTRRLNDMEASYNDFSKHYDVELKELKSEIAGLVVSPDEAPAQREVIISNVPELKQEKTLDVARVILGSIDPSLNGSEISRASPFPSKHGPKLIKATLRSSQQRSQLF